MEKPTRKGTRGVPRGDHNEAASKPRERDAEEYGDENPFQKPGEQATEPRPGPPERESPDEPVEREQER